MAQLYDRHAGAVFGVLMRVLKRRTEAEDLLHDVFLEVLRRAGDYDPRKGSVRAWVLMRARSRALDRVRSARVRRERLVGEQPEQVSLSATPEANVDHAAMRTQLERLEHSPREVIELAYFGGLSSSEIAAHLGIPLGTVKSRAAAGLRALRASYKLDAGREAERS